MTARPRGLKAELWLKAHSVRLCCYGNPSKASHPLSSRPSWGTANELIGSSRTDKKNPRVLRQTNPTKMKIPETFQIFLVYKQHLLSPEGNWFPFLLPLLTSVLIIFKPNFSIPKFPHSFLLSYSLFPSLCSMADLFSH